ncbi:glycosyltransferase family 2 protein [Caminibacter pacificus]|uniref:Glycosyl transferase family 2 n=1 Tax=Caminibacter pacificus TaxID=1424653 RepID=A0AAJ4UXB8_9BACT|nr:glycosyltransferase family 2 protein [Caminibacter pacificus]ROR39161.1 glycosyl transferase family 2 [Caminibacter pacificus]
MISVLTPTYNRADKLHRVFESIKNQTLKKIDDKYIFEWVIVDDGSSDNTKELVKKWQKEVDWPIRYIYQENKGKWRAIAKGLENIDNELTLIADSDDKFLPETFETFYNIWSSFSQEEKEKCGGIGVLCQDQFGKRVGCDYPIENELLPTLDVLFKWKNIGLGETWAILKTENLKYAFLSLPKEFEKLQFIPESFFWNRIAYELKPYSYYINKVLRIYYKEEEDNISHNIRKKYPEGFFIESKWFVTKYINIFWQYPNIYFKYLIKLIYFYFLKGKK